MLNYKSPSPTKRTSAAAGGSDVFAEQQYRKRGGRNQGQVVPETMNPYESYMDVPYQPQGGNFGLLPGPASQWFPYVQQGASAQWAQGWGFPSTQSAQRGVQYVLPGAESNVNNSPNNQGYVGYPEMQGEAEQQQSVSDAVEMSRNSGHMMPSDPMLYLQQQQQQSQLQQQPQPMQLQQQQQQQQQHQATESSAVLSTLLKQQPASSQQLQTTTGQQATPTSNQVKAEADLSTSERLPTFDQAFSQTEIGRFSHEGFHNNKQSDLPVVEGDLGLDLTFKMEYQSRNGYPFSPNGAICDYLYGATTAAADNQSYNYSTYDREFNQNRL